MPESPVRPIAPESDNRAKRRAATSIRMAIATLLFALGHGATAASDTHSESLRLAINHWVRVQESSGFLPYGFNFLRDAATEQGMTSAANLTRQAVASAALADYYLLSKDQRAHRSLQLLLEAFGRYSLPIGKSRAQTLIEKTHVLSLPVGRYRLLSGLDRFGLLYQATGPGKVLSPNSNYGNAHAGAVALALLTEVRYAQAARDNRFSGLRRAWLEGLIALRIPGEGFRVLPTSIDSTAYYDGEAWLALAEFHRTFPKDKRVGELLADLDKALLSKYGRQYNFDFFHWGVMAAAARFADTRDAQFLDFIRTQTERFLARMKNSDEGPNYCASLEGTTDAMGALLSAGEEDTALFKRTRAWSELAMQNAIRMQIQPGQRELIFSNARISAPRLAEFSGSFRNGAYEAETQVDVTGHCISAMVKLERYRSLAE